MRTPSPRRHFNRGDLIFFIGAFIFFLTMFVVAACPPPSQW